MKWYIKVINQYADFEGRAGRNEFWMFVLFNFLISLSVGIISALVTVLTENPSSAIISYAYMFAVLIPGYAVAVRRLHDIGKSGWNLLLALIPLIGGIWLLVLFASEGTPEKNRYGELPKGFGSKAVEFNRIKSVAITMIVGSVCWMVYILLDYITILIKQIHFHPTFLLPVLYAMTLFIVGVSLFSKKKLTTGVAYLLIAVSIVWILLNLRNIIGVMNYISIPDLPASFKISSVISFLGIVVPVSLLLFGLSEVSKIGNKKATAIVMRAGAIISIAIPIITMITNPFQGSDAYELLFRLLSSSLEIIMPISLLLLASYIEKPDKNTLTL